MFGALASTFNGKNDMYYVVYNAHNSLGWLVGWIKFDYVTHVHCIWQWHISSSY